MKKYLAIALALASVSLAAPAMAGSVSAQGGNKYDAKVNINEHEHVNKVTKYTEDDITRKDVKGKDNVTKVTKTVNAPDNITTKKTTKNETVNVYKNTVKVVGSATAYNDKNNTSSSTKSKKIANSSSYLATSNSSVQNAIDELAKEVKKALAEDGRSTYSDKKGAHFAYFGSNGSAWYYTKGANGKWGNFDLLEKSSMGKVTRDKSLEKSKTTSNTETTRVDNGITTTTKTDKVFTGSTTTRDHHLDNTTIEDVTTTLDKTTLSITTNELFSSPDGILIGDPDSFKNAYAAQGNHYQEISGDLDKYYTETTTKTRHYTDTYTTTDNYTETTTKTNTHNYVDNVVTTNTTTNTYKVVYQVNLTGVTSPIVLDLDGDGKIEASNGKYLPHAGDFSQNVVMFDFYGNGMPIAMEWVGTNDGLLCRPNADGTVNGTNLFGTANGYENGFDELSLLDKNHNGAIEGDELSELMVWQDENHNGVADQGELKTLESLGITSIGVNHNNYVGSFVRDGQTYKTFDWWPSSIDCRKIGVAKN